MKHVQMRYITYKKNTNFYLLILLIAFFKAMSKVPESKFLLVGNDYVPCPNMYDNTWRISFMMKIIK